MKQTVQPLDRVREVIAKARSTCANPDSAPAVAHAILNSLLYSEIEEDHEALKMLVGMAINPMIRKFLKGYTSDEGGDDVPARTRQLEMFSEALRPYVEQIDRARVFVPTRDEFVELLPDAITISEMREAGFFLIAKGEDCITRGKTLLRLADASEHADGDFAAQGRGCSQ